MHKGILVIYCIIISTFLLKGQNTFIKTLGGAGDDIAHSAIETRDGNYLVVGSTTSFGSGGKDGYISKINGSAKEIWDKAVGGSGDDVFQNGIQLNNGDFILVGWSTSFGNGSDDLLVTKIDNFGNISWTKTYGGSNDDSGFSALETSDGNIIIAGHTKSFGAGSLDVFVIKLDLDGNEIWSNAYGTSGNDWFNGNGLIEDSAGNYVLAASWWRGNGSFPHDGAFIKLDSNGNIVLLKGYGGNNNEGLNGYLRESSNGFQNIGITWSWNGANHEIWMSDLTFSGDMNWSKTFGLSGENIRIGQVQYTDDENYLISGYEFTEHTNAIGKSMLIKVSKSGNIIWSKSYSDFGIETLDAVFETNNGVIAFGKTTSYGEGGNDIFVVRTDRFGTVSGCSENINLLVNDVNPDNEDPIFFTEELSVGAFQTINVSNIDNIENVVCDGCDATDLTAGLFCETAPIICSIDCLDGFTGTLPNAFILPQPEPLCDGGIPNNVSWFAFVAGSSTVDLSIIPTNCTTIFDDNGSPATIGIQAGVYEDCNFENSFICQTDGCLDLVAETVNISSDQFQIGQVYYLFVDGCGGSVCDYEVVVNSAQQAFEMDEITTISNDLALNLEIDTLCQGTEITFILDNFDQSVNFNWIIDPPTSLYPSGIHPVIDTNAVTFQFEEEGCFDIHVYAYNECDNSETRSFSVCVQPLENEVFSDIYVCQECFPITLISPESGCIITEGGGAPTVLIEDPNGDGVPGWLGTSTINGPGLDSNIVTNVFGCTYKQFVNVVEIPISPREQVDHYFCLTDFPVIIDGSTFNSPGDSRNITLEGQAASGCDSLISVTAHGIDIFGTFGIGSCQAGEVGLAFVIGNVVPSTYDSITYTWYDAMANVVTDSDGIDSILIVTGIGSYSVQVTVHAEGASCPQTFVPPFSIDVDNLSPELPTVTYAPFEICISEQIAQIYVANQGLGENYIWTITPNMPLSFGLTSDTIYVDLSAGQDFEFCVHAINGCGSSIDFCDNVSVNESPDSEFIFDSEICIDSFIMVEYAGLFGTASSSIFNWNFDGGSILNGMAMNSGGPFEIGFPSAGVYTIGLTLEEVGCTSILTEHQVTVVEPFTPPTIDCESSLGVVTFSWDNTNVSEIDITILSGQSTFELTEDTYIISELSSEEDVNIQIEFNGNDVCGGIIILENCTSLPCPEAELEISLSIQNVCLANDSEIVLDINIIGDNSGVGNWVSPYIDDNDQFDLFEAGIGEHLISYVYVIGDCTFMADTLLSIFEIPVVDVNIYPSYCEEMGSNLIDVLTSADNTTFLDDVLIITFDGLPVSVGEHNITVTNSGGCSGGIDFNIEDFAVEDLTILGEGSIIEGNSSTYSAQINSNIEDLIMIWTLDGDTICNGCLEVMIAPETEAELCLDIYFGEGCFISNCRTIEIKQRTKIFIPNIFSPNNDNINDQFTINSNSKDVFINEIMIFDRWGEMVYNQKILNVTEEARFWDGTLNGTMCVPGVYVYIITYLDEENREKKISGDLTLIR